MYTLLISLFVFVSITLMIVILLQSSKGGGLAGVFGGGGMGAVFGGRGAATFLSKVTIVLATAYLLIALLLSLITKGSAPDQGLVQQERQKRRASTPAAVLPTVPSPDQPSVMPVEESKSKTLPASGDKKPNQ